MSLKRLHVTNCLRKSMLLEPGQQVKERATTYKLKELKRKKLTITNFLQLLILFN